MARSHFFYGPSRTLKPFRAFTGAATRWDLVLFTFAIVVPNLPLIHGRFNQSLIFLFEPVRAGEWWRVLAHPFVHVSWYHLLLDATAFLMLYHGLEQRNVLGRLFYVAASGAGSLLISLWSNPMILSSGLCGLSGVAHGLMAITGLEMMSSQSANKASKAIGTLFFSAAVLKSGVEAITGQAFFTFLHFGLLGSPIAVCHAGGAIGGMIGFLAFTWRRPTESSRSSDKSRATRYS
jgi:rhomboid family GlyGly-CTERM serine protease